MQKTVSAPIRARPISQQAPRATVNSKTSIAAVKQWNVTLMEVMKEVGLEPFEGDKAVPRIKKVVHALYEEAENGSVEAAKVIFERIEGRPAQTINVDGQIQHSWTELARQAIDAPHRIISDEEELGE